VPSRSSYTTHADSISQRLRRCGRRELAKGIWKKITEMKMRLIHGLIKDARLRRPGAGLCKRSVTRPAAPRWLIEDGCDKGVQHEGSLSSATC
jgi:hypothetical protein